MSDKTMPARLDAMHRAMRSGSPGSAEEIQRRLRANWRTQQLDPARIADICARIASGDTADLQRELIASGLTADELRTLGL